MPRPYKNLEDCIKHLCGQNPRRADYIKKKKIPFPRGGIGHSQFNELLLSLNLDRTSEGFFKYVFDSPYIKNVDAFFGKVHEYRIMACLKYGNFKFAFKQLREMSFDEIEKEFNRLQPIDESHYSKRHQPLMKLKNIDSRDTYYLGYLETSSKKDKKKREKIKAKGIHNHETYLDYDHMDVYVATSMRERMDYYNVASFIENVFMEETLKDLNIRHFDPTQAFCPNRIDKSLVEGLMLKRATCTIYMAGEVDTLGKDSELATTLAQGKPVVAYIPELDNFEAFKNNYVPKILELYSDKSQNEIILLFLRKFYPEGAWKDKRVQKWVQQKSDIDIDEAVKLIFQKAKKLYDDKATTLKQKHPLGIQVNLQEGVANGVIVVRKAKDCATTVRRILLNELKFDLKEDDKSKMTLLIEKTTGSTYRVVTKDDHLTNSFWNFYLRTDPTSREQARKVAR
ncbi:hypothetical protein JYT88_02265 [Rhodospirillaceae bacterium AH-315-P19]|nr:hypothetical protein [Rhodospirillaceae bacterium AH-315-P19]